MSGRKKSPATTDLAYGPFGVRRVGRQAKTHGGAMHMASACREAALLLALKYAFRENMRSGD